MRTPHLQVVQSQRRLDHLVLWNTNWPVENADLPLPHGFEASQLPNPRILHPPPRPALPSQRLIRRGSFLSSPRYFPPSRSSGFLSRLPKLQPLLEHKLHSEERLSRGGDKTGKGLSQLWRSLLGIHPAASSLQLKTVVGGKSSFCKRGAVDLASSPFFCASFSQPRSLLRGSLLALLRIFPARHKENHKPVDDTIGVSKGFWEL